MVNAFDLTSRGRLCWANQLAPVLCEHAGVQNFTSLVIAAKNELIKLTDALSGAEPEVDSVRTVCIDLPPTRSL